jgi:hypothetical protein
VVLWPELFELWIVLLSRPTKYSGSQVLWLNWEIAFVICVSSTRKSCPMLHYFLCLFSFSYYFCCYQCCWVCIVIYCKVVVLKLDLNTSKFCVYYCLSHIKVYFLHTLGQQNLKAQNRAWFLNNFIRDKLYFNSMNWGKIF